MRRIFLALIILLSSATLAVADTIYLRDGRVVRGTVIGFIGGRFAVRVNTAAGTSMTTTSAARTTTAEQGEIQFFRPRDVDRVELEGRSLEEARFETRTVEVGLGPNWIDTGVDLRRNERVSVTASGTILAGRSRITPAGLRTTDPNAPLPRAAEGVLVGAITDDPNAPIFEIGLSREFVADRDGRLYLTVNRSSYTDARGSFTAQVRTERDFTPRRNNTAGNRDATRDASEDDSVFGDTPRAEPAPTRPRNPASGSSSDPFGTPRDRDLERRTPREVTVSVPGNSQGMDTGVDLRSGDQVTINATGTIVAGQRVGSVGPSGKQSGAGAFLGNPRYPFPQAGVGALLGVIRDTAGRQSQPFLVGAQLVFTAQADGRLYLLVNDDNYDDNSGQFSVRIRY
ncbi:MAG: LecA/PA-IL family lectin [Acidobacteria bacterium]|nr:LecA/PA-IL family lectin [Acidobacteriota bacterium]